MGKLGPTLIKSCEANFIYMSLVIFLMNFYQNTRTNSKKKLCQTLYYILQILLSLGRFFWGIRYSCLVDHELTLPEGIKAFFVLNAPNLTDEMEKLARATTQDLTYKSMKEQIKKICGTTISRDDDDSASAPPIKDEVLFGYGGSKSSYRGYTRGRGRGGYSKYNSQDDKKNDGASNPSNSYGVKMRCFVCDSTSHLFKDCPKYDSNI